MTLDTVGKRLKWAREQHGQYSTGSKAARAHGWPVSTYLGHESGERVPKRTTAIKYAQRFGVRWEWLLEGDGRPFASDRPKRAHAVGYVGAGAEVVPIDDHAPGAGLEEVDIPPGTPADAVLVIVRGNSMYPRYFDNECLFYTRSDRPPGDYVGRECIVKLSDGRMFVKILRRGSNGYFNLESWNAPLIENAEVEWAAPVLARVNRS